IKPSTVYRYKERVERWGAWLALLTWVPFIGDIFAVVLGFFKARFWPSAWFMLLGKGLRFVAWAAIYYWVEPLF
ncbi:MAG: DedA family protein, partial [Alistipes sp.]|nr:DedA family protein [Alistipes sp.]